MSDDLSDHRGKVPDKPAPVQAAEDAAAIPSEEDIVKQLDENEQPVLVRIVEWQEWIPGAVHEIGEGKDGKMKKMAMYNGITGFSASKHERLVDLGVTGTGITKMVEVADEDWEPDPDAENTEPLDERPTKLVPYGSYVFQAVLALNADEAVIQALRATQMGPLVEFDKLERERQETEGRDRRSDLLGPDGEPVKPAAANRAARRKKRR